jgi:hypothetical protein
VKDLVARVGTVERSSALKALFAWVDRGVLREETENVDVQCFRLLERVPEDAGVAPVGMTTAGSRTALAEEEPAMLTVQQQQAEQMKVFWKVRHSVLGIRAGAGRACVIDGGSSSRVCSRTSAGYRWIASRRCSSSHRGTTARSINSAGSWMQRVAKASLVSRTAFGASIGSPANEAPDSSRFLGYNDNAAKNKGWSAGSALLV